MNPGTYYVPEGETRRLTVQGVSTGDGDLEALAFVDGSALFILCTVAEAKTDQPLFLKQFGASRLLLAGLTPDNLDPGQEVEITRYEDGGGYEVDIGPDDIDPENIEEAM